MKRFIIILATITLLSGCATQSKQINRIVDFELIKGIPVVTVSINGVITKLGIDTGADDDQICLSRRFITETRVKETTDTTQSIDINGTTHESKTYLADNVSIGPHDFINIVVSEEERDIPFDGIIGNKFFEIVGGVSIDYRNNSLEFINPDNIQSTITKGSWNKVSYTKAREGIVIPVTYNGFTYSFVFDTGNAIFIDNTIYGIINTKHFNQITENDNTPLLKLNNIYVDGEKYDALFFYATELPELFTADGILGYNILKNKRIVIDYLNHTLYFSK